MKPTPFHVSVSAEAFAAASFARLGYDVSVQYGANQPGYDLVIVKDKKILKVNVKGSQDGGWGINQSFKKGRNYQQTAEAWYEKQDPSIAFCFVQFKGVGLDQIPRMYLARPNEVARRLKESSKGRGETILYERKIWSNRAHAAGTEDKIPNEWKFSRERIEQMFM